MKSALCEKKVIGVESQDIYDCLLMYHCYDRVRKIHEYMKSLLIPFMCFYIKERALKISTWKGNITQYFTFATFVTCQKDVQGS